MYTTDKTALQWVQSVIGIRKQSIQVVACESVAFQNRNWDDGCRNVYYLLNLETKCSIKDTSADCHMQPDQTFRMQPGIGVVRVAYSGQNKYVTLYVHPDNLPQQIESAPATSINERIVLWFTRCRKSTMYGQKNYRYIEASRYFPISLEAWEAAKMTLIEKKLLTKAGGLTPAGKNASPKSMNEYSLKTELGL